MNKKFVITMVVIFLLLALVFGAMGVYAPQFQTLPLHIANAVMLVLSLLAYMLMNKTVADRPHAFVRGVYSASLLRLFICMAAMLAYVLLNRGSLHKPTVFVLLGVYAVYSGTETYLLSRTARKH
ncbi:hypothetical protein GCM10023093_00590 [Nemorincola caseinilytica]|uniref:ATP synthase subunit I n=1 Tax=Nemorincola caseinilytica TaxID=2054315 RepID=A0ABP8N143_9BACT